MTRLIVHADDFGLSAKVNRGILEAHVDGCLTSTSLLAGGDAFDDAVRLAEATPTLDVGVHLTLAEERPLLDPQSVPSLVDASGRMHRHATVFTRRYFLGRIRIDDVRRELEAQVRKVIDAGIRPSHLDGHQHLHVLPAILRETVALARRFDIPAVRYPAESLAPYVFGPRALTRLPQLLVLRAFCRLGRHQRVARTDRFAGFAFGGGLDGPRLRTVLRSLPRAGTCELMCHPGAADPATRYAHWGYRWSDELAALTDPATLRLIDERGIRLISFQGL